MQIEEKVLLLERKKKRVQEAYVLDDDTGYISPEYLNERLERLTAAQKHLEPERLPPLGLHILTEYLSCEEIFPPTKWAEFIRDDGKIFWINENERRLIKLRQKLIYNLNLKEWEPTHFLTMTVKPEKYHQLMELGNYIREFMNRLKTYIRWRIHSDLTDPRFHEWANQNISYVWVIERASDIEKEMRIHAHFLLTLPKWFSDEMTAHDHHYRHKTVRTYQHRVIQTYLENLGIYEITKIKSKRQSAWYCSKYTTKTGDFSHHFGRSTGCSRDIAPIPDDKRLFYHSQVNKYELIPKEKHEYIVFSCEMIKYKKDDYQSRTCIQTHENEINTCCPPEKYQEYHKNRKNLLFRLREIINQGKKNLITRKG